MFADSVWDGNLVHRAFYEPFTRNIYGTGQIARLHTGRVPVNTRKLKRTTLNTKKKKNKSQFNFAFHCIFKKVIGHLYLTVNINEVEYPIKYVGKIIQPK